MKYIYLKAINWNESFEDVNGSYYDRVATISSGSKDKEQRMAIELLQKEWREIPTNNGIRVFLKDRHVVRIIPVWN